MGVLIRALLALTFSFTPFAAAGAPQGNTEYDAKIKQGEALLRTRQWDEALKTYKQANSLMDKKSALAQLGMAKAYEGLLAHKSAADACTEALKHATGDTVLEPPIRNLRGTSLFALAQKTDDKRLKQAEEDFRTIIAMTDTMPIVQYNLGLVLLKQGRDEEGIKELNAYIEKAGRGQEVAHAKRFVANPRRAREPFAPDFSFTTLDGEHVTLEDLAGKVVLIDFWATWCGPCLKATPGLARLQKKLEQQPFVILGISADRSRAAWSDFVTSNRLKWHHYLDETRKLTTQFGVNAFPTYMLLDHEGFVRQTWVGWNPSTDGDIESQAKKLLKALAPK